MSLVASVYSFPTRGQPCNIIVAELSYRSLRTAATAWPDRVVDECLAVTLWHYFGQNNAGRNRDYGSFWCKCAGPNGLVDVSRHCSTSCRGGSNLAYTRTLASDVLLECCPVGAMSLVKLSHSVSQSVIDHHGRQFQGVALKGPGTRGRVGMWQACMQITVAVGLGGRPLSTGRLGRLGRPGQGTCYWLWLGQALRLSCPGAGIPGRRRKLTWPIEEADGGEGRGKPDRYPGT